MLLEPTLIQQPIQSLQLMDQIQVMLIILGVMQQIQSHMVINQMEMVVM